MKKPRTHWRILRKESGNLNQKAGPMGVRVDKELEKADKLDEQQVQEAFKCTSCFSDISVAEVRCQDGLCDVCFAIEKGSEFDDTVEEPALPDMIDPCPSKETGIQHTAYEPDEESEK